jgi:hypothetical protein
VGNWRWIDWVLPIVWAVFFTLLGYLIGIFHNTVFYTRFSRELADTDRQFQQRMDRAVSERIKELGAVP